jgi:trimeric autotransporter adhesin
MNKLRRISLVFASMLAGVLMASTSQARLDQRSISSYLDAAGHLQLPADFQGNLNVAGYRMETRGSGAPRFLQNENLAKTVNDAGQWMGFGGLPNGCNGSINAMAKLPNGDIVIGGSFNLCVDVVAHHVAIYSPGTNSFSSLGLGLANGVNSTVNALAISGNDIYVGGAFTKAGSIAAGNLARWNASGWSAVGGNATVTANSAVDAIAVSGQTIYVGGRFSNFGGVAASKIAQWNGSVWSNLGQGLSSTNSYPVNALAVLGTNLYVGGSFTAAGGQPISYLARWNGANWSSVGSGVDATVLALATMGTNLIVGGSFGNAGGLPANRVARWDGSAWSAIGDGMVGSISAISIAGSDIYVCGSLAISPNIIANNVARWNGSTWVVVGTGSQVGISGGLQKTLLFSNGSLYVGGDFASSHAVNEIPSNNFTRTDGITWSAVGTGTGQGANDRVAALAASGSKIYVGGSFTHIGGINANNIAMWDGSQWTTLGSGPLNGVNNFVNAIAIEGNNVYVGGGFNLAGSIQANYVAKWDGLNWSALSDLRRRQFRATCRTVHVARGTLEWQRLVAAGYGAEQWGR